MSKNFQFNYLARIDLLLIDQEIKINDPFESVKLFLA